MWKWVRWGPGVGKGVGVSHMLSKTQVTSSLGVGKKVKGGAQEGSTLHATVCYLGDLRVAQRTWRRVRSLTRA